MVRGANSDSGVNCGAEGRKQAAIAYQLLLINGSLLSG